MDRDPDVYDHERLHSPNAGLSWCEKYIVDVVLLKGTHTLEKWIQDIRKGSGGQKAVQYADVLLADFIRHCVIDGFREVEEPIRSAYKPFAEAQQKWHDARLATEEATCAWEVSMKDFRPKLKVLGKWAQSVTLARFRRLWRVEPNPCTYLTIVGTSSLLRTPDDVVKYHDSILFGIDFIRQALQYEVIEGCLECPVGMSDFELSLKAYEAAQARVEARQNEEVAAEAALDSAKLNYFEERHKAIAVLQPLSEAGRWALFRLVCCNTESLEAGKSCIAAVPL